MTENGCDWFNSSSLSLLNKLQNGLLTLNWGSTLMYDKVTNKITLFDWCWMITSLNRENIYLHVVLVWVSIFNWQCLLLLQVLYFYFSHISDLSLLLYQQPHKTTPSTCYLWKYSLSAKNNSKLSSNKQFSWNWTESALLPIPLYK